MSQDAQIIQLLNSLTQRLGEIEAKIDLLDTRTESPADTELSAYPNAYITPKEALPHLKLRSTQGLYAACRAGQFRPGTELIDISPAGSERPTYLINVRAYFKRLREEQKRLAS